MFFKRISRVFEASSSVHSCNRIQVMFLCLIFLQLGSCDHYQVTAFA
jgi:hypothetical protein